MKKFFLLLAAAALLCVAGCATTSNQSSSPARPDTHPDTGIIGKIPASSPLSKVKMDMSMKQVYDLIGSPTDTHTYPTGKCFNPFYFGNDSIRIEARYKGQGRVVFCDGGFSEAQVLRVEYDPSETGYGR